jgi:hypothetical protein
MFGDRTFNFIWNHGNKIAKVYFPVMFANGFYRGTQSMNYYDYKDGKIKDKDELYINKFIDCTFLGFAHATWYGPIAIYQMIGRIEIELTNKNPYDHENLYRDMFSNITLKPKKKEEKNI